MTAYCKIYYYDEPSDTEFYESLDEAAEAYSTAIEQFQSCGRQMGDIAAIAYGSWTEKHGRKQKAITEFA